MSIPKNHAHLYVVPGKITLQFGSLPGGIGEKGRDVPTDKAPYVEAGVTD